MFLMFGMQYLLAGGYALRVDAHVRVDVIYSMLPRRTQAITDVVTSVAFFIFTGVLFWTGVEFARRAIRAMDSGCSRVPRDLSRGRKTPGHHADGTQVSHGRISRA
jgi:TRAP-type mannitol/chloroaromatic compound transport system permease small subunit